MALRPVPLALQLRNDHGGSARITPYLHGVEEGMWLCAEVVIDLLHSFNNGETKVIIELFGPTPGKEQSALSQFSKGRTHRHRPSTKFGQFFNE
jgi:hypothetical protein